MTQTYRTTDGTRWGAGKGSRLTPTEVDINFWDIIQRVITLETDMPDAAASIDFFEVVGTQFYVHMINDTSVLGPYDLPQFDLNETGEWQASFSYAVNDVFTINGGVYRVPTAHVSGLTFDAGANDGMGNDYYKLWIQTPGNAIPTGGAVGQVVQKASATEFATSWGWKLPTGGSARQYLIKVNGTQDNAEWGTPQASDIEFTPVTDSDLVSDNVADAIEELSVAVAAAAEAGGGALSELSDILFATGDPQQGAVLFFEDPEWTASAGPISSRDILRWSGTAWVPGEPTPDLIRDPTITALGTTGTVSLDPTLGNVFTITPTGNVTLNAATNPAGAEITLIITTSGTTSYNITPNINFRHAGVLATGVANDKVFVMKFISDGNDFYEVSRTAAY